MVNARLTILINKLDNLSYEEFHKYWSEQHPKIWLNVDIVKKNVLRYNQFHVDRTESDKLKAMGLPIATYDGGVEIVCASQEELMAIFQDPQYLKEVVPDEEKFLKRGEAVMMLGWDETKVHDAKQI